MLQLGIRGLGIARFKFNPLSWFAKGEQGAWYDPSDLTTLFQDSAGTLPAALEYPVGLMLDKSKGLALGAELVTNGTFSVDTAGPTVTGWTANGTAPSTAAVTSGKFIVTTSTGTGYGRQGQVLTLTVGATYKITATIRVVSGTSPISFFYLGPMTGGFGAVKILNNNTTSARSYTGFFTPTQATNYLVVGDDTVATNAVIEADNISVKQIAGNHAFQATSANRPILSARVNLLTKTEDFSDGVWDKVGTAPTITINSILSPIGTLTANKLVFSASGTSNRINQVFGVSSLHKISLWMKGEVGGENISIWDGWNPTTGYTLTTSWQLYSITQTTINPSAGLYLNATNGTPTIYAWGADLRPTNSGALLPAYQRVNTASDYDSVGFPLYLKANGTSSAMSTNSIDFTSTDKMTVVTGVALKGTAEGLEIELGLGGASVGGFTFEFNAIFAGDHASQMTATSYKYTPSSSYPVKVYTDLFDRAGASVNLQIIQRNNGVISSSTVFGTALATGNFANLSINLFGRSTGLLRLEHNFYGAIIRGAQSDTASVTQTEQYMATKTGITF
jgi:hypothetical protein